MSLREYVSEIRSYDKFDRFLVCFYIVCMVIGVVALIGGLTA